MKMVIILNTYIIIGIQELLGIPIIYYIFKMIHHK